MLSLTSLLLRVYTNLAVLFHALKELLAALRMTNVLNTDVHALFNVAVADNLVDNHTNGVRSDVVYNASSANDNLII